MAQIDPLIRRYDSDQAASVASLKRLCGEVLIHPIVLVIVNDAKHMPVKRIHKLLLRTMQLLNHLVFDIEVIVWFVLHNSSEFDIVHP